MQHGPFMNAVVLQGMNLVGIDQSGGLGGGKAIAAPPDLGSGAAAAPGQGRVGRRYGGRCGAGDAVTQSVQQQVLGRLHGSDGEVLIATADHMTSQLGNGVASHGLGDAGV